MASLQCFNTEDRGVRQSPGQHPMELAQSVTAKQINETAFHWDVHDICCPDMV